MDGEDGNDHTAPQSSSLSSTYTVCIRGRPFTLTRDQLFRDGPNFFTTAFGEDWSEATSRRIDIPDRNPDLFEKYIVDYLAGYELPWQEFTKNPTLLANLSKDAEWYQLDKLSEMLQGCKPMKVEVTEPQAPDLTQRVHLLRSNPDTGTLADLLRIQNVHVNLNYEPDEKMFRYT